MKKKTSLLTAILLFTLITLNHVIAQTKKGPLNFEDARLWRAHSVTLADNGEWYTTHYSLFDEPDFIKDTLTEQKVTAYYGEDNQTDVLYIFRVKDGLKYQVPDGKRPIFSSKSDWIAYQIKPESEKKKGDKGKKEEVYIELKHLESGFTVKYESDASYQFLEDKDYFITTDKNSLLVYDLKNRKEHYIGNIGEYLVDKKSEYIVYTIASEDKRGNGVYLYDPKKMTTRALQTGNFLYNSLSWNNNRDALAFYKYNKADNEVDHANIKIVVISGIETESTQFIEYSAKDMEGFREDMGFVVKTRKSFNGIKWSKDENRLFLKIKKYDNKEKEKAKDGNTEKKSSVQVWHGEDEKLLSERIMEYDKKKKETFEAIFFRNTNSLIQLTGEEIQRLDMSKGTDQWAVGMDYRKYISDWDVKKSDLYSINLNTGEKVLIQKNHSKSKSNYRISPDGEKLLFWDGAHYWIYHFKTDTRKNITQGLSISFINKDYDRYGFSPNYGFTGWVKNKNAVIVNHKHDLWQLPLDNESQAQNLTASITTKDSIRFRFEDYSFKNELEIEDRYIDLSSPVFLYAFNTQTKHAGFYKLENRQLKKLIFRPSNYSQAWQRNKIIKSKHSEVIIYTQGDYQNYPEAYLGTSDFKSVKKITNTNPQQKLYKWGKRILIDYKNDDGVPLQAVLSIPEDYKKGKHLPMIVWSYEKASNGLYTYSVPYVSGSTATEMFYVSEGYLYLKPDIHFNVGTPHSDMHECIDAAIEKVIELGYVDKDRIGYEGFSFGGHCGMYISTQENKFAAIAAGAGVSNLVQGFNIDIVKKGSNEQDYYITGQGRLGTDPISDTEMYIRESAVFQAQTMNTPLLLFHGTDDKVVHWEHSFGFYNILRYLKKPVVFLSYLGEGHGMRKEENRMDLQKRLKEYFDHYLKGEKAKKWMIEEFPYVPDKESKNNNKRMLSKWK